MTATWLPSALLTRMYKEAGATLEYRVKSQGKSTKFADLLRRMA